MEAVLLMLDVVGVTIVLLWAAKGSGRSGLLAWRAGPVAAPSRAPDKAKAPSRAPDPARAPFRVSDPASAPFRAPDPARAPFRRGT